MYLSRRCVIRLSVCLFVGILLPFAGMAQELPSFFKYAPRVTDIVKHKRPFDDPRPIFKTWNDKKMCPPEVYNMIVGDPGQMKAAWADVVGFKATDVVGKVHPEIKPGKYTYKDVQNSPAFKKLIWPTLYDRIKPGGPPFAGNIPEFEIIPTRHYYYSSRIAEATKRNTGKTKLDAKGYVDCRTWEGGFPFPRPSGPFKAQQVAYNALVFRQDRDEGNGKVYGIVFGYDKNFKKDVEGEWDAILLRLAGRSVMPPYGWYDEQAKARGELGLLTLFQYTPRDVAGTSLLTTHYLDASQLNAAVIYLPSLRRVRKMSTTDTQDPISGQDLIYDDQSGFTQKLSPTRYPYKYEVEESEYLVAAPTLDGAEYATSKGLEIHGLKFERRPVYVLTMTQTDPNYVYGKRVLVIDRETFVFYHVDNYDQKGRLYRSWWTPYLFKPDTGMTTWGGYQVYRDHIDLHSDIVFVTTAVGKITRDETVASLTKRSK